MRCDCRARRRSEQQKDSLHSSVVMPGYHGNRGEWQRGDAWLPWQPCFINIVTISTMKDSTLFPDIFSFKASDSTVLQACRLTGHLVLHKVVFVSPETLVQLPADGHGGDSIAVVLHEYWNCSASTLIKFWMHMYISIRINIIPFVYNMWNVISCSATQGRSRCVL